MFLLDILEKIIRNSFILSKIQDAASKDLTCYPHVQTQPHYIMMEVGGQRWAETGRGNNIIIWEIYCGSCHILFMFHYNFAAD